MWTRLASHTYLSLLPRLLVDGFAYLPPYTGGMSRYERPSHQIYMSFFLRSGWQVQFLEPDLRQPFRGVHVC
jgi:hypothetical protein